MRRALLWCAAREEGEREEEKGGRKEKEKRVKGKGEREGEKKERVAGGIRGGGRERVRCGFGQKRCVRRTRKRKQGGDLD